MPITKPSTSGFRRRSSTGSLRSRLRLFAPIVSPQIRRLPLVAVLGLIASVLEGIGIGALIPLVAILLGEGRPDALASQSPWIQGLVGNLPAATAIFLFGAAILAFMLLKGLVQALNNTLISRVHSRMSKSLMDALAAKSVQLDYDFFLRTNSSRLINIMSYDSWNLAELFKLLLVAIPAFAGLCVFALALIWLNWLLFLVLVSASLLIIGALHQLVRIQNRLSMAIMQESLTLNQLLLQIVTGTRTIRIFNQEKRDQARFCDATGNVWEGIHRTERLTGLISPGVDFMLAAVFIVILLGAYSMGLATSEVVVFLALMSRAQPHASLLLFTRSQVASRRGTIAEVEWMLGHPAQNPACRTRDVSGPPAALPLDLDQPIHFDHVSYTYPDGQIAVADACFTFQPGVSTALIGSSGSGKTTLVNLLCGLIEPTSGVIRLGDCPIGAIDAQTWRTTLAVAGQDMDLFAGTVAQNIAYGRPEASREEIEDAARSAGASGFVAELDHGFDTLIGEHGVRLSGGQRQRIGLARALLARPQWLILDEATNAVDAMSEIEINALMEEGSYFSSLIRISHRYNSLMRCQNGIVIENARIVETGPLHTLNYHRLMCAAA